MESAVRTGLLDQMEPEAMRFIGHNAVPVTSGLTEPWLGPLPARQRSASGLDMKQDNRLCRACGDQFGLAGPLASDSILAFLYVRYSVCPTGMHASGASGVREARVGAPAKDSSGCGFQAFA